MRLLLLLAAGCSVTLHQAAAQTPTPMPSLPPKVVETSPKAWQTGVNPQQHQLSVTFDEPMSPAYTAWLGRTSRVEQVDANSTVSADHRTFSVKAELHPGKVYVLSLNEKRIPGVGFQNEKGVSAPPYFLVFQTAGNPAPAELPPRATATNPTNNSQQLDPSKVKSITITFDRAMQATKHGLHMLENKKEVDLSKAKFQYSPDGKSFTIAYDFKPSSAYECELNSAQDIGFASAQRIPLWPVRFAFSTGALQ